MSPLSRRTLLTSALGAVAVAAGAAGCSRGSAGTTDAGGQDSIRFAWWGSTPRHEMTEEALDLFREANPDLAVTGEPGDFSGYFDRLATQTAGGDAPDVITLGGAYVAEYAQRGALLDLGEVTDRLDLSGLDESAVTGGQVAGTQYAATAGVNALSVITNPDLFEQAGVELPDQASWTWDDFEELAAEISAATPDGVFGSAGTLTHDSIDCWARQRGEALYTPEGGLGLTEDTLAELFDVCLRMVEDGGSPPANLLIELNGVANEQTLLGTGRAAMMLTWSNAIGPMSEASGADLQLLDLPGEGANPGLWLQPSQYYSISARSQNPDASAGLIDFLLNSLDAGAITKTDRGVPANAEVREAITPDLDVYGQAEVAYIDQQSSKALQQLVIGPAGSTAVASITTRVLDDLLFGRTSSSEAAASWMEQAEAAIA